MLHQRTDFKHKDILRYTGDHRKEILAAFFTLARSWIQAGEPKPEKVPPLGSFEKWQFVIGGILEHAGLSSFLENAEDVYLKSDSGLEDWQRFLEFIYDWKEQSTWTVAEIAARLQSEEAFKNQPEQDNTNIVDFLPEKLDTAWHDRNKSFKKITGKALSSKVDMRYPCGLILKKADVYNHTQRWEVIKLSNQTKLLGGEGN